MRIAILHSRVRLEERMLLEAFARLGADAELRDARTVVMDPHDVSPWRGFDAVLNRCMGVVQSLAFARYFESVGVRSLNSASCVATCGDKIATDFALARANVSAPRARMAVSVEAALRAIDELGYPAVIKPAVGSWGRLLARVTDRETAETVLEHKGALGSTNGAVFYLQEHIDKPARDIRAWTIAGETVAAIARTSEHWITNTARGASVEALDVSPELAALCAAAARSVGGDIVAVDVLECPRRGLLVNEVNHNCEFRNSVEPTGVDIPGAIAERVVDAARSVAASVVEPSAEPTAEGAPA